MSLFPMFSLDSSESSLIFQFGILASLLHKANLHDPNYVLFLFNYSVLYLKKPANLFLLLLLFL